MSRRGKSETTYSVCRRESLFLSLFIAQLKTICQCCCNNNNENKSLIQFRQFERMLQWVSWRVARGTVVSVNRRPLIINPFNFANKNWNCMKSGALSYCTLSSNANDTDADAESERERETVERDMIEC